MDKLQVIARSLDWVAGAHIGKLACWSGALVFNYHRIGDAAGSLYDHALFSATQDGFDEQMAFLARNFDVIEPADLVGLSRAPKGRHVMVTFDDGYRDNYELAYPVLRARGMSATFFITAGFLDNGVLAWWDEIAWMVRHASQARLPAGPWLRQELSIEPPHREASIQTLLTHYKALRGGRGAEFIDWLAVATGSGRCPETDARRMWMTWDMVREMRAGGMVIGGHTVNHPVLSRLTPEGQAAEITATAARIREELDEPMRWFAYPVGGRDAFDAHTRRALEEAGVELAFSYYGGYRRHGDEWDRYDIKRVAIESMHDRARFRATVCLPSLYGSNDASWATRLRGLAAEFMEP